MFANHIYEKGFMYMIYKKETTSQVLVAHTCNPSYSGGRDQKDLGSKPAQGK
jgi:hypothetical protein